MNYIQATKVLDDLKVKNGFLMHISHSTQEFIERNSIHLKYKYLENNQEFYFD